MAWIIEPSEEALADFDRLYDFIAQYNPRAAAKMLRALDAAIQRLAEQPKLGRVYRHRGRTLRVLTHRDYLVFYRERPDAIRLVRIFHGHEDIPDILDEFESP